MYSRIRIAYVALLALSGCASSPTATLPSNWAFCYRGMDLDAISLVGPTGRDCGFVSLKADMTERNSSFACAKEAASADSPFRVGYQAIGTDSGICEVVVRTPDKRWAWLSVDYDRTGGVLTGDGPVLTTLSCEQVEFQKKRGPLFFTKGCTDSVEIWNSLPSNEGDMRSNQPLHPDALTRAGERQR